VLSVLVRLGMLFTSRAEWLASVSVSVFPWVLFVILFCCYRDAVWTCGIGSDPDPTNPFGFGSGAILQPNGDSGAARRDIRPLEVAVLAIGTVWRFGGGDVAFAGLERF